MRLGMGKHHREISFSHLDPSDSAITLSDVVRHENVLLGGASTGKGLKKAARYYIQNKLLQEPKPDFLELPGAAALADNADVQPLEDSFYVVDLGVLVSQVYQWRKYFPRVEPFYAVKCNPDPVIVKTLAVMGCNFDCASRNEIRLVQQVSAGLGRQPDIIYANPCKARSHLIEAVCKGVRKVTFDNVTEVHKCAAISKEIQLILRIITDDRGSQCRLSTKFGAPRNKWRPLLKAAAAHGMQVVGVSFHVGSGCRDATRYEMALKDAREIFDLAEKEFNMKMTILDIGGGFPGETYSMWNPAAELDEALAEEEDDVVDEKEGITTEVKEEEAKDDRYMFFTEIAEQVAPAIDQYFPVESGVRIIAEPGRYFVAACATLCCSVVSARSNELDTEFNPEGISDSQAALELHEMSREEEGELVRHRGMSMGQLECDNTLSTIHEGLAEYTRLFASQQLVQQEVDVYNDTIDLFHEGFESAADLLGPPDEEQKTRTHHTVEGLTYPLFATSINEDADDMNSGFLTLAAAGEAAVNGMMMQAVADSLQDDYAYYINDGVYGAFNNIMFDHATVRPRVLRASGMVMATHIDGGFRKLDRGGNSSDDEAPKERDELFASTVWGCTCDSIDLLVRSALLPKLHVGDYLYFQNMGAYTMAAASCFNGFTPSERFYVCSVKPEYFQDLISGPDTDALDEKKDWR